MNKRPQYSPEVRERAMRLVMTSEQVFKAGLFIAVLFLIVEIAGGGSRFVKKRIWPWRNGKGNDPLFLRGKRFGQIVEFDSGRFDPAFLPFKLAEIVGGFFEFAELGDVFLHPGLGLNDLFMQRV